jgi:hypothetical protein
MINLVLMFNSSFSSCDRFLAFSYDAFSKRAVGPKPKAQCNGCRHDCPVRGEANVHSLPYPEVKSSMNRRDEMDAGDGLMLSSLQNEPS